MFINAKQIYNIDSQKQEDILQAEGFFLNKATADIYINGIVDGFALSHNSLGFFIVKLNSVLNMVWYSVFDFGKSPVGGQMLVDSTKVYSIFGYESDLINSHRWGLTALSSSDGTVKEDSSNPVVVSLINGTEITRNSTRNFY